MAKRRRTTPQPITSVRIETPAPATSLEPESDVRRPWSWQREAIAKLKNSDRRMLTAPTGSGKSAVVQSLGLHDLGQGRKVIVAVPQLSIGRGYGRETIDLDGERREWDPCVQVQTAEVRRIVRFLTRRGDERREMAPSNLGIWTAMGRLRVVAHTPSIPMRWLVGTMPGGVQTHGLIVRA